MRIKTQYTVPSRSYLTHMYIYIRNINRGVVIPKSAARTPQYNLNDDERACIFLCAYCCTLQCVRRACLFSFYRTGRTPLSCRAALARPRTRDVPVCSNTRAANRVL